MPHCFDVMHQYGRIPDNTDIRQLALQNPPVAMCPGDFLGSDTTPGVMTAALISTDQAWAGTLTATQVAAAAAGKFIGVNLQEVDTDVCAVLPDCIPYAYRRTGSLFRRA